MQQYRPEELLANERYERAGEFKWLNAVYTKTPIKEQAPEISQSKL